MLGGASSNWIKITSGVPQGPVLGPQGFESYMNRFADDAIIMIEVTERPRHSPALVRVLAEVQPGQMQSDKDMR